MKDNQNDQCISHRLRCTCGVFSAGLTFGLLYFVISLVHRLMTKGVTVTLTEAQAAMMAEMLNVGPDESQRT